MDSRFLKQAVGVRNSNFLPLWLEYRYTSFFLTIAETWLAAVSQLLFHLLDTTYCMTHRGSAAWGGCCSAWVCPKCTAGLCFIIIIDKASLDAEQVLNTPETEQFLSNGMWWAHILCRPRKGSYMLPRKNIHRHRAGIKCIPQLQKAGFIIAVIVDLEQWHNGHTYS